MLYLVIALAIIVVAVVHGFIQVRKGLALMFLNGWVKQEFLADVIAAKRRHYSRKEEFNPFKVEGCTGNILTCPDKECMECSVRDCPYEDPLHYHHDGCPSCWDNR